MEKKSDFLDTVKFGIVMFIVCIMHAFVYFAFIYKDISF